MREAKVFSAFHLAWVKTAKSDTPTPLSIFLRHCLNVRIEYPLVTFLFCSYGGIYILAKSKLKNITLSLMAIHAEMRDMEERQKLQAIIESLKKMTEGMK
jgi:hypothetical protein